MISTETASPPSSPKEQDIEISKKRKKVEEIETIVTETNHKMRKTDENQKVDVESSKEEVAPRMFCSSDISFY